MPALNPNNKKQDTTAVGTQGPVKKLSQQTQQGPISPVGNFIDTAQAKKNLQVLPDHFRVLGTKKIPGPKNIVADSTQNIHVKPDSLQQKTDSIPPKKVVAERFLFFQDPKDGFDYKPLKAYVARHDKNFEHKTLAVIEKYHQRAHLSWTLVIGFISLLILLGLKTYFKKFMEQVASTMINTQLADKMFREKNFVVRRAFFMLNLNHIIVFSLFIQVLSAHWGFRFTASYLLDYLIIIGGLTGIILIKMALTLLSGFIFEHLTTANEHLHYIHLINKNIGIILLPLVFIAIFSPAKMAEITLYFGIIIVCIGSLFKLFRGFQIIMRDSILLFYSFLYLCTLELLPIVLCSKLIISLR